MVAGKKHAMAAPGNFGTDCELMWWWSLGQSVAQLQRLLHDLGSIHQAHGVCSAGACTCMLATTRLVLTPWNVSQVVESASCPVQVVALGDYNMWGVGFMGDGPRVYEVRGTAVRDPSEGGSCHITRVLHKLCKDLSSALLARDCLHASTHSVTAVPECLLCSALVGYHALPCVWSCSMTLMRRKKQGYGARMYGLEGSCSGAWCLDALLGLVRVSNWQLLCPLRTALPRQFRGWQIVVSHIQDMMSAIRRWHAQWTA